MLHVHRAERTEALAGALGRLLREPLADAFATEVVAVPAQGIERWLAQRLSTVLGAGAGGDGVCSGIAFPSPTRLVDEALAAADGADPQDDAWQRPLWPLLEVVDASLGAPWCAVLSQHLGHGRDDHRRGRRYATVAHLAELFRSYAAHRPHMLRDWAAGRDTDGTGPLDPDLGWQAELWRRLRDRLGPSPAERLQERCQALRDEPQRSPLPARLALFGPTRLAADQLAALAALAGRRDVHLFLPHPSPALWAALVGHTATHRRSDPTATVPRHPLLRSLGRDVRELQLRLPPHADQRYGDDPHGDPRQGDQRPGDERPGDERPGDERPGDERPGDERAAGDLPAGTPPPTQLGLLQADLFGDRPPGPAPTGPADGTVQVHACHGPARQVEVLREVLLGLFADDPTLEPRDVLVMCPDVESFAPLVGAAFGLATEQAQLRHPGHALRVRLADRSLRQTNPLLDVVAGLLDLAQSRVTASGVLDLAASPAVRRAFRFDDDDLERVRDWVARSGVRWGIDAGTRAPYGMAAVPHNTWRTGLDRLLLGVTTSEDEPVWLDRALPLDDVDSSDIDLAGRLAELLDRLADLLSQLQGEHPAQHWLGVLAQALDLLTETREADAWQLAQARHELAEAGEGSGSQLRLSDVRAMLAGRLRGRPTRAGFRTGHLTVCTMVPMRSVPHRVVVLLGLDDGAFPRTTGVDGDDVLARDPQVGERDVRSEDRQLFLDAVLAAEQRLVLLYTGADPVSGAVRPPAVPVGELLDVVGGAVVTRHPLQPYDARDFRGTRPFSFDPVALTGAVRRTQPREAPATARRLPAPTGPVALADLVAFVEHPVRAYLRSRLRITLPGEDDEVDDALSVTLDGLQEWAVGERMLAAALGGRDPASARHAEWLRGTLPPGPLGTVVLDKVGERVEPLARVAEPLLLTPPRAVDVRLDVAGRVVSGTIGGVRDGAVVAVAYSTLSPRHRARAWVLGLALAASGEGDRAVTVGRWGRSARTSTLRAPGDPLDALARVLDLHDRGMREPLPMAVKSSAAYATSRLGGDTVEQAETSAGDQWRSDYGGEREDRHHEHVWGAQAPLATLLADPPLPDERWVADARHGAEPTRFGALACRLWAPVLAAEQTA